MTANAAPPTSSQPALKQVAAIYDIHSNLPALEAVLKQVSQLGVDHIVIGGDVFPGPMPLETFALLQQLPMPVSFIRGNCELALLAARAGDDPGPFPEPTKQAFRWIAGRLTPAAERTLRAWPRTVSLPIQGIGDVLFCHATPRDEHEIFTRLTPESAVLPAFAGAEADLVVCGHTHMQFDRIIAGCRVVNAGSVGMPFGEPGAHWLLLGPEVQRQNTGYDLAQAAQRVQATDYPQAAEFAEKFVLQQPSEESMLELFSRSAMK